MTSRTMTRPGHSYDDFALKIEPDAAGGFRILPLRSPFGGSRTTPFTPPFTAAELVHLMASLDETVWRSGTEASTRDLMRIPVQTPERDPSLTPQEVGHQLFSALFRDSIRDNLLLNLGRLESSSGQGLRIRLVTDVSQPGMAALTALPWELLCRTDRASFLVRELRTPFVRQLDVPHFISARPLLETVRVLVALSNPPGVAPLDVSRERSLIENAWGQTPRVSLQFLEHPTIRSLRQEVRQRPFDILHFVGHGGFDPHTGDGFIYLEDENGLAAKASGTVLAETLKSFGDVRLVFLNACETGRLPRRSGFAPYRGVASALVLGGVPAVIAMQFPITDLAAITFSEAFYGALASGDPLDVAVTEGRFAIYRTRDKSWEWATPVLYMGLPDGNIFALTPEQGTGNSAPAEAEREGESPSNDPTSKATEYLDQQLYKEAVQILTGHLEKSPENPTLLFRLALARIGGRRPRTLTLSTVKQVENDLRKSLLHSTGREGAHLWYLTALLKYDFYRFNGLRVSPPTVEESLAEASNAILEPFELRRLLDHVPTPQSPVRESIEKALTQAEQETPSGS